VPNTYEVVKAKTAPDAIKASIWDVGATAKVVAVDVSANGDGTFSVFPKFEKMEDE